MSRGAAVAVLAVFASLALLLALWGGRDVARLLAEMRTCRDLARIDMSAFWFIGFGAIAGLPVLALLRSRRAHGVLLGLLAAWFVGAPLAAHALVLSRGTDRGYDMAELSRPFRLAPAVARARSCEAGAHGSGAHAAGGASGGGSGAEIFSRHVPASSAWAA